MVNGKLHGRHPRREGELRARPNPRGKCAPVWLGKRAAGAPPAAACEALATRYRDPGGYAPTHHLGGVRSSLPLECDAGSVFLALPSMNLPALSGPLSFYSRAALGAAGGLCLMLLTTQAQVKIPNGRESDSRLPPKGGSWSLRMATVTDPTLPRVLLIGDSITNGYLEPVRKALAGRANIDAWITPTSQGDKSLPGTLAAILGQENYAVIHFNLGLHGWQKGRIPEGQFVPLTRQMVRALKANAPQAKLIWATITPVTVKGHPEQLDPEIQPIIAQHNKMALEVMKEEGVAIDDLDGLVHGRLELAAGDQFHWKPPAMALMTEQVAAKIGEALKK